MFKRVLWCAKNRWSLFPYRLVFWKLEQDNLKAWYNIASSDQKSSLKVELWCHVRSRLSWLPWRVPELDNPSRALHISNKVYVATAWLYHVVDKYRGARCHHASPTHLTRMPSAKTSWCMIMALIREKSSKQSNRQRYVILAGIDCVTGSQIGHGIFIKHLHSTNYSARCSYP